MIIAISGNWHVRYWETKNISGQLVRKRVTHALGKIETRGKHPPADIKTEAERFMMTVNNCEIPAENNISVADFIENIYLPFVREQKRASTAKAYTDTWKYHLAPILNRNHANIKRTRTVDVQNWLNQIFKNAPEPLSRNSLKHIKSTISAIFAHAKRLGFYDGANPVQGSTISHDATEPPETFVYSLEDVRAFLAALPEPAATAFAVASFAGLRVGEIEGLEWPDYRDGALWVTRSVWKGHVNPPKTRKSAAPVPVIKQLAERLEMHRLRSANPENGPVFRNSLGGRMDMDNMLAHAILPALNRCITCGESEGKLHRKQHHDFKRDDRIPAWHGWHAARRGLGSNLYSLGVSDKLIQAILRHSNVSVTLSYYVKAVSEDVRDAMAAFEENYADKMSRPNLQDTDRTLESVPASAPQTVN